MYYNVPINDYYVGNLYNALALCFSLATHLASKPLSFQYNMMSSDEEDTQIAGMHKVRVSLYVDSGTINTAEVLYLYIHNISVLIQGICLW